MDSITIEAADAIVTARDFCGDERAAAREVFFAQGLAATPRRMRAAFVQADREWRAAQAQAGVARPIGPDERRAIERDLPEGGDS